MLDVEAARSLACGLVAPVRAVETLALEAALGRCAARSLTAATAEPRHERSAMDGFALRLADLGADLTLPIAGTVAAGAPGVALPAGASLRIFTGALVPEGADAVVPVEDCTETEGRVTFARAPKAGENIRRIGSEQPEGGVLLRAGATIGPHHVGLLASNGISRLEVCRRPRVAVFSSGDELREATPESPEAIFDSNRPMVLALTRAAGAEALDMGILPDDFDAIVARLAPLGEGVDLILTTGAVSMGGRDHLRGAILAAGGQIEGWRVALKPGKPVMFGRLGAAALTGLPGNPLSAYVGFQLFALAQIGRLQGHDPAPLFPREARAGFDWSRKPGRAEVFAVRLVADPDAEGPVLEKLGPGSSATLFGLAEADGLAFVPAATTHVAVGDPLRWQPFGPGGLAR